VQEKLDEAYNTLGKQVQMKGFRPGKVPRRILEKRFGRHIKGEVAGGVISDAFDEAIEEHDITPVSQPVIEQGTLAKGEEFTFSLTVEIKPSIELTGWEGIDVEWETVEVADERVDTELDNLRQRNATVEAAEEGHEVVEGDMVIVEGSFAVEGTDEPRKLDGMMVLAGQATGLPSADWLSDKVLGMKVDDDRAEELTAPDNGIGEEYDGKDGKLEFKVTDIKVRKLPELDDDFAQDIGQDSLEMVKADLRFKLEEHEREHARSHAADNAVKTVIAANPFEVPIGLVRGQAEAMLREQWQQFARQGLQIQMPTLDALPEDTRNERIKDAEFVVKRSLVLEALAKIAEVEVTDEDLDAKIDEMAAEMGRHPSAIKGLLLKNNGLEGMKDRMLEDKALDTLLERANVVDVEPGHFDHDHNAEEAPADEAPAEAEEVEASKEDVAETPSEPEAPAVADAPLEEEAETPAE
jgi:trigger factor